MSEDKGIKVTDKRMFTADGELREDYRDLGAGADSGAGRAAAGGEDAPPPAAAKPAPEPAAATAKPAPEPGPAPASAESQRPPLEIPGAPPGAGPSFAELVSVMVEPIALYLGDARLPEGESMENLDAARFYIDLLDVLRAKTAGNLTAEESRMLEDILYQLRLRYVQKRG